MRHGKYIFIPYKTEGSGWEYFNYGSTAPFFNVIDFIEDADSGKPNVSISLNSDSEKPADKLQISAIYTAGKHDSPAISDNSKSPETGNDTSVDIAVLLLITGLAGIAVIALYNRNRRHGS